KKALYVLSQILSVGREGIFFKNLRKQKHLLYAIHGEANNFFGLQTLELDLRPRSDNVLPTLIATRDILDRVIDGQDVAERLQVAQAHYARTDLIEINQRRRIGYSMRGAANLANGLLSTGAIASIDDSHKLAMALTPGDMQNAAFA